ncbi:S9 family peptidase [Vineibacter terrae]|uniref:S9 family peptidase n=1 Tax=Vineibacter terrae TaxID=2586908 RepID=A0A5C8PW98_9HYPH|nr:prolyl oligopeptidase family serine peptidase [Vineibacter terrae]TXL82243.1 S9 family peptidase [Vineibacter terrae]
MPITRPYGSWLSPITADLIVAESIGLSDVQLDGAAICWIEGRPREKGRNVLVRHRAGDTPQELTPAGFNARTRVHEYGGGATVVRDGIAYASSMADQRLYRCAPDAAPVALTPAPDADDPQAGHRYADGVIDAARNRWIGVRESHAGAGGPVENTIVAVDLAAGGAGHVLASGNDFYAAPRLSPDGSRLAWLTWRHPNMPWVETELRVADIAPDGSLTAERLVAGGSGESVLQPEWAPDGILHFIADRSGWWNLYRLEGSDVRALAPRAADFAQAPWAFGMSSYAFAGAGTLVCSYWEDGIARLARLDLASLALTPFDLPYTDYGYVRARDGEAVFRAGAAGDAAAIVRLDLATGGTEVLQRAATLDADLARYVSRPQHITFATTGGRQAHAFYYPPHNPDYAAPAGSAPPLLVKCHGGPTAFSPGVLDLRTQYWTSRGIAVLDVNYGGSTGYGRAYRDQLKGQWGVVDVDDCIAGARHLAQSGLADGARAVMTGGSAGGYTTLMALARNAFAGGASHYGVSDATALARDTHKFEARYLDWLIAPLPGNEALYRERSPVHHADALRRPMIFFQGDEDRIVPPSQTEAMVEALRRNGVPVGYMLFTGEQHGFRRGANIMRALDAELYFYAQHVFEVGLVF